MTIFNLFIDFINSILEIKFLNIPLYIYLISITVIIFIFKLIELLGNADKDTKE